MDKRQIETKAALLILERGIRFKAANAPLLFRLCRLNRFTISALKAGTIAEYSMIVQEHELDTKKDDVQYLNKHIDSVCKVIAIAILNDRFKIRFANRLAKILKWKIEAMELFNICSILIEVSHALDFSSITSFLTSQMNLLMSPKLGQKISGS